MAARENEIGKARCPLCGGVASLRVSASQLAYLAMDCCKAQLFTRGDHSDTLARALRLNEPPPAAPAAAPEPPPPPAQKPAQRPPLPAPPPPAAPAAKGLGWGLLG